MGITFLSVFIRDVFFAYDPLLSMVNKKKVWSHIIYLVGGSGKT